jgi:ribosomal protein S6--L-glutamate ligase
LTEHGLRIGVVGLPGRWSTEALADALQRRTGFRLVVEPGAVVFDSASGGVQHRGVDLCALDGLVVKKLGASYDPSMQDRIELLRHVAERGVPVFSRPQSLARVVDRLSCTLALHRAGIPIPQTLVTEDADEALRAVERFGSAILKPLYTSKARGMRLLTTGAGTDLQAEIQAFRREAGPCLYVQQRIELPECDLGVAFLAGEYVGTYARIRGHGSWNTTIRDGGRYAPHDPAPETVELARRAQALFDLDFTTVDVVETPSGPLVFEVSAFGGFRGLLEGLGIDSSRHLADHVVDRIRARRARGLTRVRNA